MSRDDPFAPLPGDRTIVIPSPGRRGRPGPDLQHPDPPPTADPRGLESLTQAGGDNPLVAAATPLLGLIPGRRGSQEPDAAGLKDALAHGIRGFEARARRPVAAAQSR